MSDLEFHARVAAHGDVLGVGIGARPEEWEARLGADYVDDRSGALLRRDHGLVELTFQEERGSWSCLGFTVQVHRLRWDPGSAVPAALWDAYGGFGRSVRFGDLTAAVAALGRTVEPDDDGTAADFRRYRVPGSGVRVLVRLAPGTPEAECPVEKLDVSPAWWGVTG
ncbi:hypothetical protein [Streptomyces sp. NPDC051921]|uniref:hypothetical protein n=1 Tax=Streptomyces sp. NPDC051921 TaxID=3155806 RepID=UPI00342A3920